MGERTQTNDRRPADERRGPGPPAGPLPPVREGRPAMRSHLTNEVATYLRSAIISGRLRAGDFIRIDSVAADLQVSNTPVREALVALRGDGLVELLPNRGFRVVALSRQDIEDTYYVHRLVAGQLAARATSRLADTDLDTLERLQERISRAFVDGDHETVDELNEQFHRLINTAAESPKLSLFLRIALHYVPHATEGAIRGWPDATATDHSEIIRALRARDADAARDAMVRHIQHASELLIEHLNTQGLWPESDRP